MAHSSSPAGRGPLARRLVGQPGHLAHERADRPAQLQRPPDRLALPERHPRRLPRRRRDDHPVVRDVLHPPARRAEQERVADPRLVDHLLVQLAHPGAGAVGPARRHHREQPAVRDGAAGGDREPLRARPARQLVGDPVPGDPGAQLAELLGRVAPGQHVQHRVQRRVRQRGERRGPAHHPGQVGERPRLQRHHRHDLLGQHVERVARVAHRLDRAGRSSARRPPRRTPGRPGTSGTPRRVDTAPTWWPGPADPLQPGRRRSAAPRPAPPGRPRPCRCPAPGWTWPPRTAAARP